MNLHTDDAKRCYDELVSLLSFSLGLKLNSGDVRDSLIEICKRTILAHSNNLNSGQWMDNSEMDEFDTMELLDDMYEDSVMASSVSPDNEEKFHTVESTNVNIKVDFVAVPSSLLADDDSSSAHSNAQQNKQKTSGDQDVPQYTVTPSKNGTRLTLNTPKTASAAKRAKINYDCLDPHLPAWLIPKSPLDVIFRSGYGGLGQSELAEVIELVEEEETSESDDQVQEEDNNHRLESMQEVRGSPLVSRSDQISHTHLVESENEIGLADLPLHFGKELFKKERKGDSEKSQGHLSQQFVPSTTEYRSKFYKTDELSGNDEAIHPLDHPSCNIPLDVTGNPKLTNNATLNNMIYSTFKEFVRQYSQNKLSEEDSKEKVGLKASGAKAGQLYDYDDNTLISRTSVDTFEYKEQISSLRSRLYHLGVSSPTTNSNGSMNSPKKSAEKELGNRKIAGTSFKVSVTSKSKVEVKDGTKEIAPKAKSNNKRSSKDLKKSSTKKVPTKKSSVTRSSSDILTVSNASSKKSTSNNRK